MKFLANPVLSKEVRGRMRGNRAMVIITTYLSIIGLVTLLVYLSVVSSVSFGSSNLDTGRRVGQAIFLSVMVMALAQVCVITPSLTSSSISGERERQSYDLLVTTLLSSWHIVIGKLISALAFAALLIISVLPLAALSFLFGGVSGIEMVLGVVGLAITALICASMGIMWSTIMRTTQSSMVMAQVTVLMWLLGIPFLFVILSTLIFEQDTLRNLSETPFFMYIAGAIFCSHPFLALGFSRDLIERGENPFYFVWRTGPNVELLVPAPWLAFLVIGLLVSLLFLGISVRKVRLRRIQRAPRRIRQKA